MAPTLEVSVLLHCRVVVCFHPLKKISKSYLNNILFFFANTKKERERERDKMSVVETNKINDIKINGTTITQFELTHEQLVRRNFMKVKVQMDKSKRDYVRERKTDIGNYSIAYSVVSQEGCYPEKRHRNQDSFCCHVINGGRNLILGVFDGHGNDGDACAQIAASCLPEVLQNNTNNNKLQIIKTTKHRARHDAYNDEEFENERNQSDSPQSNLFRMTRTGEEDLSSSNSNSSSRAASRRESSEEDTNRGESYKNDKDETTANLLTTKIIDFDAQAYSDAFRAADSIIVKSLGSKCNTSGTTAVTAFFCVDNIVRFGNVGDSRIICALMGGDTNQAKKWKALQVTRDQTCFRRDERERMRKESNKNITFASIGMVLGETAYHENFEETQDLHCVAGERCDDPPRVFLSGHKFPGCAFTRSFGDTIAKELGVSAEPELTEHDLNDGKTKCIIIVSDGVSEFVSNDEVVSICEQFYPDSDKAAKEIVKLSYLKWAIEDERADDVTAIVAYIHPLNDDAENLQQSDEHMNDDFDFDDDDEHCCITNSDSSFSAKQDDDGVSSPVSTFIQRVQNFSIFGSSSFASRNV
jgi:serine/threonine protein phosphatase PrpC